MKSIWKRLWTEEDGLGMVEIVVIIAVIVVLALVFRKELESFLRSIIGKARSKTEQIME